MKIGTKTLLFGCHQFLIHPWFVYRAWKRIYRVKPNFWEMICIIIHDWGYWGCSDIDGLEGESHPLWAAKVFQTLTIKGIIEYNGGKRYYDLCKLHSKTVVDWHRHKTVSKLYWADKLGTVSMSPRLWVCLGKLTGEMAGYVSNSKYFREECETDPYKHFQHFKRVVYSNLACEFKEFY